MILILLIGVVYFLTHALNSFPSKLFKEIQLKQIVSTEMSKVKYTREGQMASINWIDVDLSQNDIHNIVNWINSVPDSDYRDRSSTIEHKH